LFQKASRLKLRFGSLKGLLAVEDLWDLPLNSTKGTSLQSIGQDLTNDLKTQETNTFQIDESSVGETSGGPNTLTQLKLDIVKEIAGVRLAENAKANEARARREKTQKIMALIDQKKDEALSNASVEELEAMLNSL